MEREQVVKIVDEVVEGLLEGGPGSGRYPAGSGKNPNSEYKQGREKDGTYLTRGDRPVKSGRSASSEAAFKQSDKAAGIYRGYSEVRRANLKAAELHKEAARRVRDEKLKKEHLKKEKEHRAKVKWMEDTDREQRGNLEMLKIVDGKVVDHRRDKSGK